MLANTSDFNPSEDAVAYADLRPVDQYMTVAFNRLVAQILEAYDHYDFMAIYKSVVNFVTVDLSAFYLDFAKDVVYIESEKALERRQMQTVFYDILKKLIQLLTPIMPHTAEEIWSYLAHEEADFVQLTDMPAVESFDNEETLLADWQAFMVFRTQAQKALEEARNAKVIGKSLEAHLTVYADASVSDLLAKLNSNIAQLLIVSDLTVTDASAPENAVIFENVAFTVDRASGEVCDRCRRISPDVAERPYQAHICQHCADIVEAFFPEAVTEGFEN